MIICRFVSLDYPPGMIHYNWLSLRVVVVVVIFSVSPFSWPFDIVVMMDFTTTVFELVSTESLQIFEES